MDFPQLLRFAVEHDASDIHIQAGMPVTLRLSGVLRQTAQPPTSDEEVRAFIASIIPERFRQNFNERITSGMDFSHALSDGARFRCSWRGRA